MRLAFILARHSSLFLLVEYHAAPPQAGKCTVPQVPVNDPVMRIEYVVRRKRIDIPVARNACISQQYGNRNFMMVCIFLYFGTCLPVESHHEYAQFIITA